MHRKQQYIVSINRPTKHFRLLSKMTFCGPFFGFRHCTQGARKRDGYISVDFSLFVLLFNTKFMHKFEFYVFQIKNCLLLMKRFVSIM